MDVIPNPFDAGREVGNPLVEVTLTSGLPARSYWRSKSEVERPLRWICNGRDISFFSVDAGRTIGDFLGLVGFNSDRLVLRGEEDVDDVEWREFDDENIQVLMDVNEWSAVSRNSREYLYILVR